MVETSRHNNYFTGSLGVILIPECACLPPLVLALTKRPQAAHRGLTLEGRSMGSPRGPYVVHQTHLRSIDSSDAVCGTVTSNAERFMETSVGRILCICRQRLVIDRPGGRSVNVDDDTIGQCRGCVGRR